MGEGKIAHGLHIVAAVHLGVRVDVDKQSTSPQCGDNIHTAGRLVWFLVYHCFYNNFQLAQAHSGWNSIMRLMACLVFAFLKCLFIHLVFTLMPFHSLTH